MKYLTAVLALALGGCATSRVVLSSKWDEHARPSYVDHLDAWVLGFVGDTRVDGRAVCLDQRAHAIQQGTSIQDGLLTLITAGIYAPTTIKVWCGN